jgi:hypothetical protein
VALLTALVFIIDHSTPRALPGCFQGPVRFLQERDTDLKPSLIHPIIFTVSSNHLKPFLFLILFIFSTAQSVLAIDTIQPSDAWKHAGEEVYVEGVVASIHATPKGVAFINLGEAYPHQIFTGFIPSLNAFGDEPWLNGLKGKIVRIHGRINIYHAIAEIRIISKDQVVSE